MESTKVTVNTWTEGAQFQGAAFVQGDVTQCLIIEVSCQDDEEFRKFVDAGLSGVSSGIRFSSPNRERAEGMKNQAISRVAAAVKLSKERQEHVNSWSAHKEIEA